VLLYEDEGKKLLRDYAIPTPEGSTARHDTLDAALSALAPPLMVKAQVLAGGRGKLGGVLAAADAAEARAAADRLLRSEIAGHTVETVLIERQVRVARELYLAATFDGADMLMLVGNEGGIEVERFFSGERRAIEAIVVDPLYGLAEYQLRNAFDHLGIDARLWTAFTRVSLNLFRLFRGCDARLAEINPLALTAEGDLIALDARIEIDDGAFFRQPSLADIARRRDHGSGIAARLRDIAVQYVPLGGTVGLVSQGAGAGVTIMDWVALEGARLAAFVDVDYAILAGKTEDALRLTLGNLLGLTEIRSIIINFTTCGVRLDLIATSLVKVLNEFHDRMTVPLFIHLQGNRAETAHSHLAAAGISVCATLGEAVRGACRAAKESS
jgi:succinyl-CoA synthetase beta subunit